MLLKMSPVLYLLAKQSIQVVSYHIMIRKLWKFIKIYKSNMNFIVRKHFNCILNHLIIVMGPILNCLHKCNVDLNLISLRHLNPQMISRDQETSDLWGISIKLIRSSKFILWKKMDLSYRPRNTVWRLEVHTKPYSSGVPHIQVAWMVFWLYFS